MQNFNMLNIIIPPLCHFTILGQTKAQNMPHYYTVDGLKRSDKMASQNKPCLRPLTLTFLKIEEWWNNKSLI